MKNVLVILTGSLLATTIEAQMPNPVDSSKISKDVSLDEVVITATKVGKETPVAYSDISKQELSSRSNGQGIPFLISQSPFVIVTSDARTGMGYSGFRIRGTDANRINITINGIPVNDSESHTVFWANMADIASSVESIQIRRDAGTSTNRAAVFGATVAMQTEEPSLKPYGECSISIGSFGMLKYTVEGGTELLYDRFAFDARYSNIRSDDFIDRASVRMSSYYASAAFYTGNTLIKFQAFGNSERTYQAWNGVLSYLLGTDRSYNPCGEYEEDGVEKFYNNQTDNYWQYSYHLMASQRIEDFWNMNLTLHYTDGNGYYEDYKSKAKSNSYKLPEYIDPKGNTVRKIDLVRRKWLDNHFYGTVYNVNYQRDNTRLTLGAAVNNYVGDHFSRVMWTRSIDVLPQPDYEYYRNTGKKLDYNAYAKLTQRLSLLFIGCPDLQYREVHYIIGGNDDKAEEELDIHKNRNFSNPKVGINFHNNGHNAFVSFSAANRGPNRDNFTEAGPEERPTHEILYDYEAGYSFGNNRFRVGASLYFTDYNNQLILTGKISEIGEALTSNIKDSCRMSTELTRGVQITSWLNWNANVTLSQNKVKHFVEYVDNWDTGIQEINDLGTTNIAFSPDLIINSMSDFAYKGFIASFNSQVVGRQYIDNSSSKDRSIDPYSINSLRIGYAFQPEFMKEITLDVTINNLFNEKYETNAWVYLYAKNGTRKKDDGYFTQVSANAMARITFKF